MCIYQILNILYMILGLYSKDGSSCRHNRILAYRLALALEAYIYHDHSYFLESWSHLSDPVSTRHFTLESFGESILDQVKLFNPHLQHIDFVSDPHLKKTVAVCLQDGRTLRIQEAPRVTSLDDPFDPQGKEKIWMSLGDYILYFADRVIKKNFGPQIWLHNHIATLEWINDPSHRIYWDVKTQEEVDFITQGASGILVEIIGEPVSSRVYRTVKELDGQSCLTFPRISQMDPEAYWELAGVIMKKIKEKQEEHE